MSDRDLGPDPMDKAYREAEAVLSDEAARAARRARVLAAVAQAAPAPATRLRSVWWNRGGWLAAASVAGLAVLIATRFERPAQLPAPAAKSPPAASPAAQPAPPVAAPEVERKAQPARSAQAAPAPIPIAPPAADQPAYRIAPPAPPAAAPEIQEMVVTPSARRQAPPVEHRIEEPRPPPPPPEAAAAPAPSKAGAADSSVLSEIVVTTDPPERLRQAAAGGRIKEVAALLGRGVAVDAADSDGETALMKAIQADQPKTAALLLRHGAKLAHKNHAGVSARAMAAEAGDPDLNRALGIKP